MREVDLTDVIPEPIVEVGGLMGAPLAAKIEEGSELIGCLTAVVIVAIGFERFVCGAVLGVYANPV